MRSFFVPPLLEKNETQNFVFAIQVLEHMRDWREAASFLQEINRVLVKDGKALLIFPDSRNLISNFYSDYTHGFVTIWENIKSLFPDCGLKITVKKHLYGTFTGPFGLLLCSCSKVVRAPLNGFCRFFGIDCDYLTKLNYTFAKCFLIICEKM